MARRWGAIISGVTLMIPESTGSVAPVIQRASSLARKAAAHPTSHPFPSVPSRPAALAIRCRMFRLGRLALVGQQHGGREMAGGDGVDSDALASVGVRHVDGEGVERPFGRGVPHVVATPKGGDGADVDDGAGSLGGHDRHHVLAGEERRPQGHVEHMVEVLDGGVHDVAGHGGRNVVHQDVHRAEGLEGSGHHGLAVARLGQVPHEDRRRAALVSQ